MNMRVVDSLVDELHVACKANDKELFQTTFSRLLSAASEWRAQVISSVKRRMKKQNPTDYDKATFAMFQDVKVDGKYIFRDK